ncbi:hypothetical protein C8J57DRAFT_248342 [Mycena rebaudengoi]|nr:hypothetical protein C8J57DRAFT_248342 [Mycena rebaudengoi]
MLLIIGIPILTNILNRVAQPETGPSAGQDYEIVDYRVLEDGPDRTVSISTWREQAILEEEEEISVYYLSAEDYIQLERDDGPEEILYEKLPRQSSAKEIPGQSCGNAARQENIRADPNIEIPLFPPRASTPSGRRPAIQSTSSFLATSKTVLGSSSPFHATKSSGSTISTIDLSSSPTLKDVLASCEPSLTHIAPVLQRVGIARVEHLRAVARLSEENRNREVREEVLRMGVTLVEWAILLDKLRSL